MTIQSENFYLNMLKNKNLPASNNMIYEIGWIEFILKHSESLPCLVVKDYSGLIEDYFHLF